MMRLIAVLLSLLSLSAADWRQWRGFSRNGSTSEKVDIGKLPDTLSAAWSVPAGGGAAGPIVSGDRVYLFDRDSGKDRVRAFERASGKEVWAHSYPAPFKKHSSAHAYNEGPFSTPLLYNNERLLTWGISGIVSCFDAPTGRLLWRRADFSPVSTAGNFTGVAASLIGNAGRVYLHTGDDRGGKFRALDVETGKDVWAVDVGAGPGYSSPVIHNFRGVSMLISISNASVFAVAEEDGRLLWTYPFPDTWLENIVTPLVDQDKVLVSGVRQGTHLLKMELLEGGRWTVHRAWYEADLPMYMSSPIADGDTVYALSFRKKGQFVAFSLETGKRLWESEGRETNHAALLSADGAILAMTVEGDLLILKKEKEKLSIAKRYPISDSDVWAFPAFSGGELFVKDATHLRMFRGL